MRLIFISLTVSGTTDPKKVYQRAGDFNVTFYSFQKNNLNNPRPSFCYNSGNELF